MDYQRSMIFFNFRLYSSDQSLTLPNTSPSSIKESSVVVCPRCQHSTEECSTKALNASSCCGSTATTIRDCPSPKRKLSFRIPGFERIWTPILFNEHDSNKVTNRPPSLTSCAAARHFSLIQARTRFCTFVQFRDQNMEPENVGLDALSSNTHWNPDRP